MKKSNKILFLLMLLIFFGGLAQGQTNYTQSFDATGWGGSYSDYVLAGSPSGDWLIQDAFRETSNQRTGAAACRFDNEFADGQSITSPEITEGIDSITLWLRHWDGDANLLTYKLETSTDGLVWDSVDVICEDFNSTTYEKYGKKIDDATVKYIKITHVSGNERLIVDDFEILGLNGGGSNDADSYADDNGITQPAGISFSSLFDTEGEAIPLFQFKIVDLGSSDGLPTEVTAITIKGGTNNTADWSTTFGGGYLYKESSGTTIGMSGSVTITPSSATFPIADGELDVADGDSEIVTLYGYLSTTVTDGTVIEGMIDADAHGFTADAAGSTFLTDFGTDIIGNQFTIDVAATELTYLEQPSNVEVGATMSPTVQVAAVDANGNVDEDYSSNITLAFSGTGNMSGTNPVAALYGVAMFPDLSFDTEQTNVTLEATDGSLTGVTSNTFDITTVFVAPDVFISEYIEGSSSNKAIEIYNNTGSDIDLSEYSLKLSPNANPWGTTEVLSGTLANGDVFVIANPGANQTILDVADLTSTVTFFNGDDAIGLFYNDNLIDIVGVESIDPGDGWEVAGTTEATLNHTIIRKYPDITTGNTDWTASAGTNTTDSEWEVYNIDDFSYIGWHGTPPPTIENIVQDPASGITPSDAVTVSADITDDGTIVRAQILYGFSSGTYDQTAIDMTLGVAPSYSGVIPAQAEGTTVYYVVEAEDNDGKISTSSEMSYIVGSIPITSIYDIQYSLTGASPLDGQTVATTGFVTAVNGFNFHMQDSASAWNGIFVYQGSSGTAVAVGDSVVVSGDVDEYFDLTEITNVTDVTVASSSNPPLIPVAISTGDMDEMYEGVLISISGAECITTDAGNGMWTLLNGATQDDSLLVDDDMYAFTPTLSSIYDVTGIGHYSYSNYKILPREAGDIVDVTSYPPTVENIAQDPASGVTPSDAVTISADITDDGTIARAQILFGFSTGTYDQTAIDMTLGVAPSYAGDIPAQVDGTTVYYVVEAEDDEGNVTTSPEMSYDVAQPVTTPVIANIAIDIANPTPNDDVTVSADITDDISIVSAFINWGTASGVLPNQVAMSAAKGLYTGVIPAQAEGTTVYFTVEATDGDANTTTSDEQSYTVAAAFVAPDVFISEYIEGSSSNKAIEIYNGTGGSIDLSAYSVKLAANDNSWGTTEVLSGTLNAGDVFVIANASADQTILDASDVISTVTYFNGNDAVGLFYNDELIDVVGIPASNVNHSVAGTADALAEHTLIRKYPDVTTGNTDWAASAGTNTTDSEWEVYNQDDFTYIGWHGAAPATPPTVENIAQDPASGVTPSDAVTISADITDDGTIARAQILFGFSTGTYDQTAIDMTLGVAPSYAGDIPAQVDGTTVYYVVEAEDDEGNVTTSPEMSYDVAQPVTTPVIANIAIDIANPTPNDDVTVSADITDDVSITSAFINWGTASGSYPNQVAMSAAKGLYTGVIPAQAEGTTVYFTVEATDGDANTTTSDEQSYTVVPTPVVPNVFISEYIEGSSSNKAIEIYNGTGGSIDLSAYSVKLASNDNSWGTTEVLSGTLNAGDVFVIANASADQTILDASDVISTVTYFNGNDAVGLFYNDELIDVVGIPASNVNHSVAGTADALAEHTLIRKYPDVTTGNTDWAASAGTNTTDSEWEVYNQDDFTFIGWHGASVTSPTIENIAQDPASGVTPSDPVTITADITDDGTIARAQILYGFATGTYDQTAIDMTLGVAPSYAGDIPAQADGTTVYYVVEAEDDEGNITTSSEMSYDVATPVSEPVIANISIDPAAPTVDDAVTVSADITDDVSISLAVVKWGTVSGTWTDINMTASTGDTYVADTDIPAQTEGTTVYYLVEATDGDANTTSSEVMSYNVTAVPTSILFFSEYIEGSSSNKAIEIYNPSSSAVDLTGYTVKLASNGGTWGNTVDLTGSLAANDVYVIANASADQTILDLADITSTVTFFNGDDALGLFFNDVLIDAIGTQGEDPGTAWAVAGIADATAEHTLVRKAGIVEGNTDWVASAGTSTSDSEWEVYDQDDFTHLGDHNTTVLPTPPTIENIVLSPAVPSSNDAVSIAADITDEGTIASAELHWGTASGNLTNTITMSVSTGDTYVTDTDIPAQTAGTTIYYEITATDDTPETTTTSEMSYTVIAPITVPVIANIAIDPTVPTVDDAVSVSADITDDVSISMATVKWGTVSGTWTDINMTVSTGDTYVADTDIPAQTEGTTVYYLVEATDGDANITSSEVMSYTVLPSGNVSIYNIQYTTDPSGDSPYAGQTVTTSGIVTAVRSNNNFFIQDGDGAWNGVFVYQSSQTIAVGDEISITADVVEYNGLTELSNPTNITINSSGNTLPTPSAIATGDMDESFEGVLINFADVECITEDAGFGMWTILNGTVQDDSLLVDDDLYAYTPTLGAHYNVTGVGHYSYGAYKVLPRDANDIEDLTPGPQISNVVIDPANPTDADPVTVSATIIDVVKSISTATLNWGLTSGSLTNEITMSNTTGDTWVTDTDIPAQTGGTTVYYMITAENDLGAQVSTSELSYFVSTTGLVSIYEIQYTTDPSGDSPYLGQTITTSGIVTAVNETASKFYIQDGDGSWNGLYVYQNTAGFTIAVGDEIEIDGTVEEYFGVTELMDITDLTVLSTGNTLPSAAAISTGDMAEEYEGVLISVAAAECINTDAGFGMWTILNGTVQDDSLLVDDDMYAYIPEIAHTYNVTGVGHYSYGAFKILPREEADIVDVTTGTAPVISDVATDPANPTVDDAVSVSAVITDDGTVATATLFWGTDAGSITNEIAMSNNTGDTYVTDTQIPAQTAGTTVYYFVRAIDDEGLTANSAMADYTVIGIDEFSASAVAIYPNPAKEFVNIETGIKGKFTVNVYSVIGELVYTEEFESAETAINVSNFEKGMYHVQIIDIASKQSVIKKLIVK